MDARAFSIFIYFLGRTRYGKFLNFCHKLNKWTTLFFFCFLDFFCTSSYCLLFLLLPAVMGCIRLLPSSLSFFFFCVFCYYLIVAAVNLNTVFVVADSMKDLLEPHSSRVDFDVALLSWETKSILEYRLSSLSTEVSLIYRNEQGTH